MNLETAATLARNVAAIVCAVSVLMMTVTLLSGGVGISIALANAFVLVAVSALGAFALAGLLIWVTGASLGWIGVITAALVLTGAFLGGHWFGVRGLWVAALGACGAGLAWLFLWAFGRELPPPLGMMGPVAAFALLAFLSFGALGALTRTAASAGARAEQPEKLAFTRIARPPAWFDCAYAALGGAAEAPGQCALTPPATASDVALAGLGAAPSGEADPALDPASAMADVEAPRAAGAAVEARSAPETVAEPPAPDLTIPEFDHTPPGVSVTAAPAPESVAPPERDVAASVGAADPATPEPERPLEPTGRVAPPEASESLPAPETPESVVFAGADAIVSGSVDDKSGFEPPAPVDERRRTALVCFPMLDAVEDRLCPDASLGPRDFEVLWREPGGEAFGAAEGVECYVDKDLTPHATLVLNLSGALAELMPRGAAGGGEVMRGDAIYGAATRIIGGVRSAADATERTRLLLSLYLVNGSKLLSPWASQDFGAGREDRLFDLRVGSQTLALLKRLKDEIQTLRRGLEPGDLASGIEEAIATRPASEKSATHPLMLVITDPEAAVLDASQQDRIIAAFRAIGAPFFAIELGAAAISPGLRAVAEATGGAVFVAPDAASLEAAVVQSLLRARSFCTLRVSAPESFFDRGALEIRLRRKLQDSCVFEQVAQLDCSKLSISERYETPTSAGR